MAEAARSILTEDVDLELVAIDDGSRDGSRAILRDLPQTRVVDLGSEGEGIVGALERGRAVARGRFIARMDADDLNLPGRLGAQRDALDEDPALQVLGTRVEAFGEVGEGLRRYVEWQNGLLSPSDHEAALFVESPLCHPSVMMRAATLDAIGGYREGDFPEDYDLWLRFSSAGYALAKLPMLGVRWRHTDGRLTFTDPRYRPGAFLQLKVEHLAPRLAGREVVVWGAGRTGKHFLRALEPHGVRASAFLDIDPAKIGRTARGAPILPLDALERAPGRVVLVALGARGARAEATAHLRARGFVEGEDFICVS